MLVLYSLMGSLHGYVIFLYEQNCMPQNLFFFLWKIQFSSLTLNMKCVYKSIDFYISVTFLRLGLYLDWKANTSEVIKCSVCFMCDWVSLKGIFGIPQKHTIDVNVLN